jgi:hypothetical protein
MVDIVLIVIFLMLMYQYITNIKTMSTFHIRNKIENLNKIDAILNLCHYKIKYEYV